MVIHHNPECGTSRNAVEIVKAAGDEPVIREYLDTGWTKPQLQALFAAAGLTPRSALRETKSPAAELGLLSEDVPPETILGRMVQHPILVNRPIVATPKGAKLCRPSEGVLDLLEGLPPGPLAKEDGRLTIDAAGQRTGPALI